MMLFKLILTLTTLLGASHTTTAQPSVACLAGGQDFLDCCPAKDPSDGVCTLLHCVNLDSLEIRDNCNCAELEEACSQVIVFAAILPELPGMCDAVDDCCGSADTANSDWNTCMETKDIDVPNFDAMIPGGIPVLEPGPVIIDAGEEELGPVIVDEGDDSGELTDPTVPAVADTIPATEAVVPDTIPATEAAVPDTIPATEAAVPDTIPATEAAVPDTIPATEAAVTNPTVPDTMPANIQALPPPSMGCIAGGKDFVECCPAADPDDGICTMLWCVDLDAVEIKDGCECGQIVTACTQVSMFGGLIEGLSDMCEAVGTCCDADSTTNDEFDTCIASAMENGDFVVPDLAPLLPNGLPGMSPGDDEDIATETEPTEPATATTVAPDEVEFTEPDSSKETDTSDATMFAIASGVLIGSSLLVMMLG